MPGGGVVISVRNEELVRHYIGAGVYGPKFRHGTGDDPNHNWYVLALSDVACCREGDHVFFHCRGRFVYGGRILGSTKHGAFFLNGRRGFLGERAEAPLVWDESGWGQQDPPAMTDAGPGRGSSEYPPFLIRFHDELGIAGRWVEDDSLYFELRSYPYMLPTNWMRSTIISISPGEAAMLHAMLLDDPEERLRPRDEVAGGLMDDPMPYDSVHGPRLLGANTVDDIVAALLADPRQLPSTMPPEGAAIVHRVPISPYRPNDVPTADIAWYSAPRLNEGTVPDGLVYVESRRAGLDMRRRIDRQQMWIERLLGSDIDDVEVRAVAPEFAPEFYESDREETTSKLREVRVPLNRSGL